MGEKIKIVLVDDYSIVRDGIKYLLEEEENIEVIGEASNGKEAISLVNKVEPDILLIDIRMPVMSGISAVKELSKLNSKTKSIMLSMHDSEEYILDSISANAMGYLLKDAGKEEILKAINNVYKGEKYYSGDISEVIVNNLMKKSTSNISIQNEDIQELESNKYNLTKKELVILRLIVEGKTNIEISETLNNSRRTVETHRFNLMKKMQVKNLIELSEKAKMYYP